MEQKLKPLKPFVITLKSDTSSLNKYLSDFNLDPQFIKGVDGRICSKDEIEKGANKYWKTYGPRTTIGCALSHMMVWKKFIDSFEENKLENTENKLNDEKENNENKEEKENDEWCLIFEDDVILENNFEQNLNKIMEYVPKDFDILYLGCFGCNSKNNFFTKTMNTFNMCNEFEYINDYINKPSVALGLHSYIISKKGANILYKNLYGKIYNHIDFCIQKLNADNIIKCYVSNPRLAYQTSSNSTTSSLNVNSNHPYILNKLLSNINLDQGVKLDYISTLSIAKIGPININIISILFLCFGIIFACCNINLTHITQFYLLLSLIDIYFIFNNKQNVIILIFHYLLIILPSIIRKYCSKNKNNNNNEN